jgi:hypothetical protein
MRQVTVHEDVADEGERYFSTGLDRGDSVAKYSTVTGVLPCWRFIFGGVLAGRLLISIPDYHEILSGGWGATPKGE